MALGAFGMAMLVGGGWYVSRLAPRVAQRMGAAAAAPGCAAAYRRFEHPFFHSMSREEALLVLGFDSAAAPATADVKTRHRALVSRFHADVAGSPLVAQKINEARDVLIKP